MQHADQHKEAIARTVKVRNEVSCEIFDDKVQFMGSVTVANGTITVKLDSFPSLTTTDATGEFMADAIALGIRACWKAKPEAFEFNAL